MGFLADTIASLPQQRYKYNPPNSGTQEEGYGPGYWENVDTGERYNGTPPLSQQVTMAPSGGWIQMYNGDGTLTPDYQQAIVAGNANREAEDRGTRLRLLAGAGLAAGATGLIPGSTGTVGTTGMGGLAGEVSAEEIAAANAAGGFGGAPYMGAGTLGATAAPALTAAGAGSTLSKLATGASTLGSLANIGTGLAGLTMADKLASSASDAAKAADPFSANRASYVAPLNELLNKPNPVSDYASTYGGAFGTAASTPVTVNPAYTAAALTPLTVNADYANAATAPVSVDPRYETAASTALTVNPQYAAAASTTSPVASFRDIYSQQLKDLMADPLGKLTSIPGYQAGLEAVQRAGAAQGWTGSGNMMTELQKYGGNFFQQQLANLSALTQMGQGAAQTDTTNLAGLSQAQLAAQQQGTTNLGNLNAAELFAQQQRLAALAGLAGTQLGAQQQGVQNLSGLNVAEQAAKQQGVANLGALVQAGTTSTSDREKLLAQLAGAGASPASAAYIGQQGQTNAAQLMGNALNNITYGLTNMGRQIG